MAQKHINTSTPNDNLGDTLRDANLKCEDNFTELYANKVDKISGKGLSTNDYTTAEKTKLAGIPTDAEKNVQSDWLVNDPDSDAFIKNKPDLVTSVNWGDIQGDIANQYDLQNALDQKPSFDYVDGKISQSVNAGTYDYAPSEDAVYNALTLKEDTSDKNIANGYAGLDANGKLFSSQLPALAISETFVVASESAMLAISGAETGDIAVRTDLNKTFILKQSPASTLANWQELLTPTDSVTSVFGRTGAVVANAGDYTTALVTETTNKRYQTDIQAARNDATSSIQTQLDSKALDSSVVHKAGDETVTGVKTYSNTGIYNTAAQIGMQITTTNNKGLTVTAGGANTAIDGTSTDLIGVAGRSTNSTGVLAQTTNGVYIAEFFGAGSRQAYVASTGDILAKRFVKSGGTSTQYLMADGSTSTLTNPITGSLNQNYVPVSNGAGALVNSKFYSTSLEMRVIGNNGFYSGYDSTNTDRNGMLMFGSGGVTIQSETSGVPGGNILLNPSGLNCRVGLGTNAPSAKFHSYGRNLTVSNESTYAAMFSNNSNKGVIVGYDTTKNVGHIGSINPSIAWTDLSLNINGGNVGIGTDAPTSYASTYKTLALNGTAGSVLEFKVADVSKGYISFDTGSMTFSNQQNIPTSFTTNNIERLSIAGGGAVTMSSLAGTGTRQVQVDASGILSATVTAPQGGTYTPTITLSTNVIECMLNGTSVYSRVGNVVTATINFQCRVTSANTQSNISFTLPIDRTVLNSTPCGSGTLINNSFVAPVPALANISGNNTTSFSITFYPNIAINVFLGSVTIQYEI